MIGPSNKTMSGFGYGAQPPLLSQPEPMTLVTDSQDPERGPAWFFQTPYDKVVILEENQLTAPLSKRDADTRHSFADYKRLGVTQPGDKPWFCYWNGTLLEAYIYVNLTSSSAGQTSATASSAGPLPTSTGSSTSTSTNVSSEYGDPTWSQGYPKVVKVEERRIPDQSTPPYCIQNIIAANGTATPYLNSTNQPTILYLNESVPNSVSPISDKRALLDPLRPREPSILSKSSSACCGCVWLAT